LSGEFIPASLQLLRPRGRFIEIGRRDIWDAGRVAAVRPDVRYETVNLASLIREEPTRVGAMLQALVQQVATGALAPLPVERFMATQIVDAFRHMSQAQHIGKIVITRHMPVVSGDGAVLITGGLAGVGLRVAQWLATSGARELVLFARGAPSEDARGAIAEIERGGARVHVVQGSVADETDVRRAVAAADRPIRGIVHAAGVLDDGVLSQQDWSRFATVFAPKVSGSWVLHTISRELPLEWFAMFSSAVSVLGSAGQANHAAACAFQDGLAWRRTAFGLPALAINWGPWSEVGSVVRQKVGDRLRGKGLVAMEPPDALAVFAALLQDPRCPQVTVLRGDWRHIASDDRRESDRFFDRVAAASPVAGRSTAAASSVTPPANMADEWRQLPSRERAKRVAAFVRAEIGAVLGLDASFVVDPQQGLRDLGIDSLMSIEVRNRLQAGLGQPLPSTVVFDYPTVQALIDLIEQRLGVLGNGQVDEARDGEVSASEQEVAAVAGLSQDEAEALLLEELSRGQSGRGGN
jgi:NADPH:quinone reductase-like Zn-dependent oxidoreductase/acyl carrier protein